MLTAAAQNRYGQNPEPAASNSTWLRVYDPTFVVSLQPSAVSRQYFFSDY